MNNVKILERMLKRVIVPLYPILKDVDVQIMGGAFDVYFYTVAYTVSETIDLSLAKEITNETKSLFTMLDNNGGISVYFYDKNKNFAQ